MPAIQGLKYKIEPLIGDVVRMRIVIIMHELSSIKKFMDEIYDRHHKIIRKYNRLKNTIIFVNGDTIKGYSASSRKDGLSADVAIGVDAEYITRYSEIKDSVWDLEKLYGYLNNVENLLNKHVQQLEKDIVNGTSNKIPVGILFIYPPGGTLN